MELAQWASVFVLCVSIGVKKSFHTLGVRNVGLTCPLCERAFIVFSLINTTVSHMKRHGYAHIGRTHEQSRDIPWSEMPS